MGKIKWVDCGLLISRNEEETIHFPLQIEINQLLNGINQLLNGTNQLQIGII